MAGEGSVQRPVGKFAVGEADSIELDYESSGSVAVKRAEEHIAAELRLSISFCLNDMIDMSLPPFPFPPGGAMEVSRLSVLQGYGTYEDNKTSSRKRFSRVLVESICGK